MRSLLPLLLVATAHAHPIDRFLAAAEGAEVVVIIPRLEAITEPLASGLRRMRMVPSLKVYLGSEEALPWALLEPDFQRKTGIDPRGSFTYAVLSTERLPSGESRLEGAKPMPAGPVLRIPVTGRDVVEGLLTAMGRTVTPLSDGWQTEEGVAAFRDGGLFGAANDAILQGFFSDKESRETLKRCPRGPGEADLYILARAETGRGCLTVRVDADRLVVEARGDGLPERWFGDGDAALLARVGADSTTLLALHLSPAALFKGIADERMRPLVQAFDGRVALGAGPDLGVATLVFGLADEAAARKALTTHATDLGLVAAGADWQIVLKKPLETKGLPKVEAVFVGVRSGALLVTTRRSQLDAPLEKPALAAGLEKPVIALANRTGGRPHNGQVLMDTLTPVLGTSSSESMKPWIFAAAWLGGHLGAWSLSITRDGKEIRLRAEVELL